MVTKVSEETAIRDAFEEQVRIMYGVLLDALVQSGTDNSSVQEAGDRFKKGLSLARMAMSLATQLVSE